MQDSPRNPVAEPAPFDYAKALSNRYAWVVLGALATLIVGWIAVTHPTEAPTLGGVVLGPSLYYLQWVVYAAIIALLGMRLAQYRRSRTPRQDVGFVFAVTTLYLMGFLLHYTPFVYEFPEPPLAGVVRAGFMIGCGVLGAMYGLSSKHRWR